MKARKILAVISAMSVLSSAAITASAAQDLSPTGNVNKFDIGSENVGGSGVEDGKNWIKVVQSSNPGLKLFEDIGPDVNVTALAVTFDISEWSGSDFSVSWGANIDFFNDEATTWCGTSAFEDISEYTISGNGEYTLVCDLSALCASMGKDGISHLQTCEMVIGGVEENDPTVIEVKSARIYVDGEAPEAAVLPPEDTDTETDEDTQETDSSEADSTDDGSQSADDSSSEAQSSSSSAEASSSTAASSTQSSASAQPSAAQSNTNTASNTSSSADQANSDNAETGAAENTFLALAAVSAAAAVIVKRKV